MSGLEGLQREVAAAEAVAVGARGTMTVGNTVDRARVSRYHAPAIIAAGLILGWMLARRLGAPRLAYAAGSVFAPTAVPVRRPSMIPVLLAGSRLVPLAWPLAMRWMERWRTVRALRYASPD